MALKATLRMFLWNTGKQRRWLQTMIFPYDNFAVATRNPRKLVTGSLDPFSDDISIGSELNFRDDVLKR